MDRRLAEQERRVRANPASAAAQLELARGYERSGRRGDAFLRYWRARELGHSEAASVDELGAAIAVSQRDALDRLGGATRLASLRRGRDAVAWAWGRVPPRDPVVAVSLQGLVRDEDLVHIGQLESLLHVQLFGAHGVTRQGLESLAQLTSLESVRLHDVTHLSEGLALLASLPWLKELDLSGSGVVDGGLAELSRSPALTTLRLNRTQVTSAGLRALSPLRGLRHLELAQTAVCDDGLPALSRLESLETLVLTGCWSLSGAGVTALSDLAPGVRIYQHS